MSFKIDDNVECIESPPNNGSYKIKVGEQFVIKSFSKKDKNISRNEKWDYDECFNPKYFKLIKEIKPATYNQKEGWNFDEEDN